MPRLAILSCLTTLLLALSSQTLAQPQDPCPSVCECSGSFNEVANCKGRNLTGLPADVSDNILDLILSENRFTAIESRMFQHLPQLIGLKLNSNRISIVAADAFAGLINLKSLILEDNQIALIHDRTFAPMKLEHLELSKNRLTSLGKEVVRDLSNLTEWPYLFSNPWHCDCHLIDAWLLFKDVTFQPNCSTPAHIAGKKWKELSESDLICTGEETTKTVVPTAKATKATAKVEKSSVGSTTESTETTQETRFNETTTGKTIDDDFEWPLEFIVLAVIILILFCCLCLDFYCLWTVFKSNDLTGRQRVAAGFATGEESPLLGVTSDSG